MTDKITLEGWAIISTDSSGLVTYIEEGKIYDDEEEAKEASKIGRHSDSRLGVKMVKIDVFI